MEGMHNMHGRRMPAHAGYALIEALVEMAAAGWRAVADRVTAMRKAQHRAQARRDLHYLSDHLLKDLGLRRSQIDRMFR